MQGQGESGATQPAIGTMAAFGVEAGDGRGEQAVGQTLSMSAPRTEGETSAASSIALAEAGPELWSLVQAIRLLCGPVFPPTVTMLRVPEAQRAQSPRALAEHQP